MIQRDRYLEAMGIERWILRESTQNTGTIDTASAESSTSLSQLEQAVSKCVQCELHTTRKNTVFGVGNPDADWMFVGEAPGAEENRQGLPFVGRAGQLLNAMLSAINLQRDQVYIANVLKCRPPNNRDPLGEEVKQCEPYLHQQVELIKPKIIFALGRFAAQSLLKTTRPISKLRGEVFPAYLLRNPIDKRKAWVDLVLGCKLMNNL